MVVLAGIAARKRFAYPARGTGDENVSRHEFEVERASSRLEVFADATARVAVAVPSRDLSFRRTEKPRIFTWGSSEESRFR